MSPRAASTSLLNPPRDGDFTTPPGNLCPVNSVKFSKRISPDIPSKHSLCSPRRFFLPSPSPDQGSFLPLSLSLVQVAEEECDPRASSKELGTSTLV